MLFPTVRHMHWSKTVPARFTYNLAPSGIELLATREELGLTIDDVQLGGDNYYGYAPLRTAIARRYGIAEKNIAITQGTSLANFLIAAALLNPGDEVVVEQPAYEPLLSILQPLGVTPTRIQRRAAAGYAIDAEELRSMVTGKTKAVLVSTLHNPSGVRIPVDTLREIAAVAEQVGATVIVDEVYQDFLSAAEPPAFTLAPNIVTTGSLTKVYGLSGLRTGWIFAPEAIVARAYTVYNSLGVNNSFPGDAIAERLMSRGVTETLAARSRARAAAHWEIVGEWLSTRPDLVTVRPDAGIICFPRFVEGGSSDALNTILNERFDATVVPGSYFEDDRGFRIGFGCSESMLREGLRRLDSALDILHRS